MQRAFVRVKRGVDAARRAGWRTMRLVESRAPGEACVERIAQ